MPRSKPYTEKAIHISLERAGRKMRKSEVENPHRYVHQKFTKFF
ncbi:hypothetical protein HMPREF6123_1063 [Oribacterium sinus F0268]|uniref:Uncharacterized protein n=1 Tax=Oribacterium sinus F0268 TaxID=585501 RepID=C2KX44_9FIRM|nr:hypothetical protein HMPREF6123_1063 [Oribacterium sinus F0268]